MDESGKPVRDTSELKCKDCAYYRDPENRTELAEYLTVSLFELGYFGEEYEGMVATAITSLLHSWGICMADLYFDVYSEALVESEEACAGLCFEEAR
ncbi:MAG: hypothetical protein FWD45_05685 [Coriobacteriia bacterium]|nr:hypothetical protein [Coriobacteriia bacterium]